MVVGGKVQMPTHSDDRVGSVYFLLLCGGNSCKNTFRDFSLQTIHELSLLKEAPDISQIFVWMLCSLKALTEQQLKPCVLFLQFKNLN